MKEYQKKYRANNKAYRINLTLSQREYNVISGLAQKDWLSRAEFIKTHAFSAISKVSKLPTTITDELWLLNRWILKIWNNVNQITKHTNEINYFIHEKELRSELNSLKELIFTFVNREIRKGYDS